MSILKQRRTRAQEFTVVRTDCAFEWAIMRESDGRLVDHFESEMVARRSCVSLNGGLAHVEPQHPVGCRVVLS